jgi:hypothetical protein
MADHGADATAQAHALSAEWFRASKETDNAWFEEFLTDDFRYLMGDGTIEPKDRVIALNRVIADKRYELLEVTARRYGDVLLAQGTYSARGTIPEGLAPAVQTEKYEAGVRV